ncbi:MAG: DUF5004 domain-containing protein [Dysgonamonadaceae bacterium]|jgi:hypothetical protein|nr:DUF5004 domain-containing protein [Dysgonamonadaceae bacterium]
MKNTYLKIGVLCLLVFAGACDKFENQTPPTLEEAVKAIDGTWKISKATRNGADITTLMDFSQFRISFNPDKTYALDHYLPFAVKSGGTWSLDDPQFPFNLELTESGSDETLISTFNYPVVDGKRRIELSFSPGCKNNIYTYTLEKVTSEN